MRPRRGCPRSFRRDRSAQPVLAGAGQQRGSADEDQRRRGETEDGRSQRHVVLGRPGAEHFRQCGEPRPLKGEDGPHRQRIDAQNHHAVHADPAQHRRPITGDHRQPRNPEQHDSEGGGQHVPLVDTGRQWRRIPEIEKRQDQQVEHATADRVPRGNVGRVENDNRAGTGNELRQGGHRGHDEQPHPSAAEARPIGDHIAIASQPDTRHEDEYRAGEEQSHRSGQRHHRRTPNSFSV